MNTENRTEGKPLETVSTPANDTTIPNSASDRVASQVRDILTRDEEILCVAVQKKLLLTIAPDAVVLTNRRVICYRQRLLGQVTFQDFMWRDLFDAHLKEQMLRATISVRTVHGRSLSVSDLPKAAARRIYARVQEIEEQVREERRRRELEDKRAASGSMVVGGMVPGMHSPSADCTDPVARLKRLKEMLEAGLIAQGEFDGKRAEIVAAM